MTWTVHLTGHDNLSGEEKEKFENTLVDDVRELVGDLIGVDGCVITTANVYTNTSGNVQLYPIPQDQLEG